MSAGVKGPRSAKVLRYPQDLVGEAVEAVVGALRKGEIVAIPTETVYGIAAMGTSPQGIEALYRIKARDPAKPVALAIAGLEALHVWVSEVPDAVRVLMDAFWPGPLTVVLWATDAVPRALVGVRDGRATVGIRMPDHEVPRRLIRALGSPLALTSANRAGGPSPVDATQVEAMEGLAYLIDAGPTELRGVSTVVDGTVTPPAVLRDGAIPRDRVEGLLGTA